jgi:hypothetical protein
LKKLLALLLLIAALGAGWYAASPWLAMKGLRDAAVEMDRAALEERVNFAAIRANLKDDLRGAVEREVARSESPLAQLGGGLATGLGGMAVDATINPEGIAALLVSGQLAAPLVPEDMRQGEIEWDVERGGLNAFDAQGRFADGRAGPRLHFARDGLRWDLVDLTLPGGEI